jgi:hypothetical protein
MSAARACADALFSIFLDKRFGIFEVVATPRRRPGARA